MKASKFPKATLVFASLATLTAATAALAGSSASTPGAVRPFNTGSYSGNVSGGAVLGANNTDSSNPFNDYGVEGKVQSDTGGVGILGYGQQAKSYGVYGVSFGTNGIGVYGAGDGPTPAPGSTPSSVTQSTGVVGDSHSGYGVFGSTEFPNPSALGPSNIAAGVFGIDLSSSTTDNFGVAGVTSHGFSGIAGFSSGTAAAAIYGFAQNGDGLNVTSANGAGALISANEFDAIDADPGTSPGASGLFVNAGTNQYGAYFVNNAGIAVRAAAASGTALYATTTAGTAVSIGAGSGFGIAIGPSTGIGEKIVNTAGTGIDSQGGQYGVVARAPSTEYPIVATDGNDHNVFYVDGVGNVHYHGALMTFARTRNGFSAQTFGARSSAPTIEDTGSAALVNGRAAVALDPGLIEQMDLASNYRVFITPDGDTNGLYVESKTPRGFIVREIHGGHGTLDFDYRIVAAVDGQAARRMSVVREDLATAAMPRAARVPFVSPHAPEHHLETSKEAARLAQLRGHGAVPHFYIPQSNGYVEHRVR